MGYYGYSNCIPSTILETNLVLKCRQLPHLDTIMSYFDRAPSSHQETLLWKFNMYVYILVALGGIDQPSTTYLAFGKYLKRSGSTIRMYVSYL